MSVESQMSRLFSLECEISMSGELRQLERGLLQITDRCCLDLSIKNHASLLVDELTTNELTANTFGLKSCSASQYASVCNRLSSARIPPKVPKHATDERYLQL
jgi:hypothetical protein